MLGPSHRLAGAAAWTGIAPLLGVSGWQLAAGVLVAAATANGRLSPDMDRYPILGKCIPGGHRGITHWYVIPLLIFVGSYYVWHIWPNRYVILLMWAISIAWASHILTDGVFGRIPIWPKGLRRWRYMGLGLRTGGKIEKLFAVPVFIAAGLWFTFITYG
jgi:hypothetical protein